MFVLWKYSLGIFIGYMVYDLLETAVIVYRENKKNSEAVYDNGTYGFLHSLLVPELMRLYEKELEENDMDLVSMPVPSNELRKILPEPRGGGISRTWHVLMLLSLSGMALMYIVISSGL